MPKQIKVDEKDKLILSALCEDARLRNKQIASKLNLSQVTVARRINKLKKLQVIKKIVPILDFKKIGRPFIYFILLDPNGLSRSLEKYLENSYEVISLYFLEDGKLFLKAAFEDKLALNNFINKIKKSFECQVIGLYEVKSASYEERGIFHNFPELKVETQVDDQSKITLSNNKLKLTMDLSRGGIITTLVSTNNGINLVFSELGLLFDTFLETQFWLDELQITHPYYDIKRNEDWIELNFRKSVKAISNLKDLEVNKSLRIEKNSNNLKIKYSLINHGETQKKLTLWVCNYLSSNLFSELVIPVNDEIKRIKVINDSSRGFFVISSEESDELSEKYWHGDWKLFKHPEKLVDKIGYFSKALKLIFMFHFDPDQVWTVKRFWGEKYVSLELIFNPVVLSPEGSITYNFAVSLSSESSLIKVLEKSASMPNIVSF
ncbi:MAG: AsnC family transcriptional regulator [Thermoproteota archaeon]|nr:AsnC family transcriptional regulator [Candidatus Brockarchaeota archaeon]